jgi:DNA-binding CsgD family transcriptional regulator
LSAGVGTSLPSITNSKFIAAVEAIYDAAPDPARWRHALQAVADVFDDVGAILSYGGDDGRFGAIGSPRLDRLLHEYATTFNGNDLRSLRGQERGIHLIKDAVTDRDVVSDEEMETHPFYTFLARHGLKHFVGASISPDSRVVAFLAVQRAIDKSPYNDDELNLMTALSHHTEKSLRLGIRLFNAERIAEGLGEALTRIDMGVFVLDALGRVLFQNPAGQRLVGRGLNITHDVLGVAPCPDRTKIETMLKESVRGVQHQIDNPRPLLIDRGDSERALTLYVLPIGAGAAPNVKMLAHARAIVLVIEPESDELPDPAQVRDLLGITLGEARVAALVGSGIAPRETAEKLQLSEETVRTSLKRIFSKVGVSRQSELVTLLGRRTLK